MASYVYFWSISLVKRSLALFFFADNNFPFFISLIIVHLQGKRTVEIEGRNNSWSGRTGACRYFRFRGLIFVVWVVVPVNRCEKIIADQGFQIFHQVAEVYREERWCQGWYAGATCYGVGFWRQRQKVIKNKQEEELAPQRSPCWLNSFRPDGYELQLFGVRHPREKKR